MMMQYNACIQYNMTAMVIVVFTTYTVTLWVCNDRYSVVFIIHIYTLLCMCNNNGLNNGSNVEERIFENRIISLALLRAAACILQSTNDQTQYERE